MVAIRHLTKCLKFHPIHLNKSTFSGDVSRRHFALTLRCGFQNEKDKYFITTPIFYVNAAPHVGHSYCVLLADASARWNRIKGRSTLFTTGTDEHGLKIQQAALSAGVDPLTFCDDICLKFKNVFKKANIEHDQFIRTTESDHVKAVNAFWRTLKAGGHIYKGTYSGWYSIPDEAFLSGDEVEDKTLPDGTIIKVSKESGHKVSWMEESNYNFRLSRLKDDLLHWLQSHPIYPESFEPSIRSMLHNLPDLSVSRDSERLSWGIPVPDDPSQTIYVWLDALINYLTVTGYPNASPIQWPPHTQVIGKDIIKFHAIYWPAFLIAAGLDPPSRLVVHSHWLVENIKMSKSLGNVVDPMSKMEAYGTDGFRYFLLNEGSLGSDGTYSDKRLVERINSDLANTVGNLLGRCTASSVNKAQTFPPLDEEFLSQFLSVEERESHKRLYTLPDEVDCLYQDFHFSKALDVIMTRCRWANSFVQAHAPWVLAKSDDSRDYSHLQIVLHIAMETLRVCGILLQPVIPETAGRLLTKLGVPSKERGLGDAKMASGVGRDLQSGKVVLYPRLKNDGDR